MKREFNYTLIFVKYDTLQGSNQAKSFIFFLTAFAKYIIIGQLIRIRGNLEGFPLTLVSLFG